MPPFATGAVRFLMLRLWRPLRGRAPAGTVADPADMFGTKADGFVARAPDGAASRLDYSEASLDTVEALLAAASRTFTSLPEAERAGLEDGCACYILEVGRRQVGGRYVWHEGYNCPALVHGEPALRVAMLAHKKVQGRLLGDEGDNIPFHYAGWRDRVRRGTPGDDALHI